MTLVVKTAMVIGMMTINDKGDSNDLDGDYHDDGLYGDYRDENEKHLCYLDHFVQFYVHFLLFWFYILFPGYYFALGKWLTNIKNETYSKESRDRTSY